MRQTIVEMMNAKAKIIHENPDVLLKKFADKHGELWQNQESAAMRELIVTQGNKLMELRGLIYDLHVIFSKFEQSFSNVRVLK